MSWEEINTLEDEGHDIGTHSMTHRSMTENSYRRNAG